MEGPELLAFLYDEDYDELICISFYNTKLPHFLFVPFRGPSQTDHLHRNLELNMEGFVAMPAARCTITISCKQPAYLDSLVLPVSIPLVRE